MTTIKKSKIKDSWTSVSAMKDQLNMLVKEIKVHGDYLEEMKKTAKTNEIGFKLFADYDTRLLDLRSKYKMGKDPSKASIFLTKTILESLCQGPLTERELKTIVVDKCFQLGIKSTSRGTIAGLNMDIGAVCGILSQLGAIEIVNGSTSASSTNLTAASSSSNSIKEERSAAAAPSTGADGAQQTGAVLGQMAQADGKKYSPLTNAVAGPVPLPGTADLLPFIVTQRWQSQLNKYYNEIQKSIQQQQQAQLQQQQQAMMEGGYTGSSSMTIDTSAQAMASVMTSPMQTAGSTATSAAPTPTNLPIQQQHPFFPPTCVIPVALSQLAQSATPGMEAAAPQSMTVSLSPILPQRGAQHLSSHMDKQTSTTELQTLQGQTPGNTALGGDGGEVKYDEVSAADAMMVEPLDDTPTKRDVQAQVTELDLSTAFHDGGMGDNSLDFMLQDDVGALFSGQGEEHSHMDGQIHQSMDADFDELKRIGSLQHFDNMKFEDSNAILHDISTTEYGMQLEELSLIVETAQEVKASHSSSVLNGNVTQHTNSHDHDLLFPELTTSFEQEMQLPEAGPPGHLTLQDPTERVDEQFETASSLNQELLSVQDEVNSAFGSSPGKASALNYAAFTENNLGAIPAAPPAKAPPKRNRSKSTSSVNAVGNGQPYSPVGSTSSVVGGASGAAAAAGGPSRKCPSNTRMWRISPAFMNVQQHSNIMSMYGPLPAATAVAVVRNINGESISSSSSSSSNGSGISSAALTPAVVSSAAVNPGVVVKSEIAQQQQQVPTRSYTYYTNQTGSGPPTQFPSSTYNLLRYPLEMISKWSKINYEIQVMNELEERLVRRIAGQCNVSLRSFVSYRMGTKYINNTANTVASTVAPPPVIEESPCVEEQEDPVREDAVKEPAGGAAGLPEGGYGGSSAASSAATVAAAMMSSAGAKINSLYEDQEKFTSAFLLDKVKRLKRQRGLCLHTSGSGATGSSSASGNSIGMFNPGYVTSLNGICQQTMQYQWQHGLPSATLGATAPTIPTATPAPALAGRNSKSSGSGKKSSPSSASLDLVVEDSSVSNNKQSHYLVTNTTQPVLEYAKNLHHHLPFAGQSHVTATAGSSVGSSLALNSSSGGGGSGSSQQAATFHQFAYSMNQKHYASPLTLPGEHLPLASKHSGKREMRQFLHIPDVSVYTTEVPWSLLAKEFAVLGGDDGLMSMIHSTSAAGRTPSTSQAALPFSSSSASMSSMAVGSRSNTAPQSAGNLSRQSSRISLQTESDIYASGHKRRQSGNALSSLSTAKQTPHSGSASNLLLTGAKRGLEVEAPAFHEFILTDSDEVLYADRDAMDVEEVQQLQQRHDTEGQEEQEGEDLSDALFLRRHEATLQRMREKWALMQKLKQEVKGTGNLKSGSHQKSHGSHGHASSTPILQTAVSSVVKMEQQQQQALQEHLQSPPQAAPVQLQLSHSSKKSKQRSGGGGSGVKQYPHPYQNLKSRSQSPKAATTGQATTHTAPDSQGAAAAATSSLEVAIESSSISAVEPQDAHSDYYIPADGTGSEVSGDSNRQTQFRLPSPTNSSSDATLPVAALAAPIATPQPLVISTDNGAAKDESIAVPVNSGDAQGTRPASTRKRKSPSAVTQDSPADAINTASVPVPTSTVKRRGRPPKIPRVLHPAAVTEAAPEVQASPVEVPAVVPAVAVAPSPPPPSAAAPPPPAVPPAAASVSAPALAPAPTMTTRRTPLDALRMVAEYGDDDDEEEESATTALVSKIGTPLVLSKPRDNGAADPVPLSMERVTENEGSNLDDFHNRRLRSNSGHNSKSATPRTSSANLRSSSQRSTRSSSKASSVANKSAASSSSSSSSSSDDSDKDSAAFVHSQ